MRPGLLQPLVCLQQRRKHKIKSRYTELKDTVQSNLASLHRTTTVWFFLSAQGVLALSAHTSLSYAEGASPISKCPVLHGSSTISLLNGSSIFLQEMAGPKADTASLQQLLKRKGGEARQGKPNTLAEQIQPRGHPQ